MSPCQIVIVPPLGEGLNQYLDWLGVVDGGPELYTICLLGTLHLAVQMRRTRTVRTELDLALS